VTPTTSPDDLPEALFDYVQAWQRQELVYRLTKFPTTEKMRLLNQEGIGPGTVWHEQIASKLHRAHVLGVDTPNGRQAIAKCAAAALSLAETAVLVYGELPYGGVESGYGLDRTFPFDPPRP